MISCHFNYIIKAKFWVLDYNWWWQRHLRFSLLFLCFSQTFGSCFNLLLFAWSFNHIIIMSPFSSINRWYHFNSLIFIIQLLFILIIIDFIILINHYILMLLNISIKTFNRNLTAFMLLHIICIHILFLILFTFNINLFVLI